MSRFKDMKPEFIEAQEILELLKICTKTLYNMIKDGRFPAHYMIIGGKRVWFNLDVYDWIEEQHKKAS